MVKISYEVFPPTIYVKESFTSLINDLSISNPFFISVTYKSKEESRSITANFVKMIQNEFNIRSAAHFVGLDTDKDVLINLFKEYWDDGIRSIVALRGDIKKGIENKYYSSDLVRILRSINNFDISVAGYPELSLYSKDLQTDLYYLKKKVDEGADRIITQFFYNPDKLLKYRDNCINYGINKEIVPGILPFNNFEQIKKIKKMAPNIEIPTNLLAKLELTKDNKNEFDKIIEIYTLNMVEKLISNGIKHVHIYTLNKSNQSVRLYNNLIDKKIIINKE